MNPMDKQIGGNHYKDFAIQPSEFCQKNRFNWLESCVIKYVCRHGMKNGAEDIKKAIHCLQMLLFLEYGKVEQPPNNEAWHFPETVFVRTETPERQADKVAQEFEEFMKAFFFGQGDPVSEAYDLICATETWLRMKKLHGVDISAGKSKVLSDGKRRGYYAEVL